MSSSTSALDLIEASQAGKEATANDLFDSGSPATMFGRRASTTSGLTWGYYGGTVIVNGVITVIPNGTLTLTGSSTNYIGVTEDGVVEVETTANPLHTPLYSVTTSSDSITEYTDQRMYAKYLRNRFAEIELTSENVELTQLQALCDSLVITGTLTAQRDLIVPLLRRRWSVRHTGEDYGVRVIGSSGSGVVISDGSAAIVECDGVNVYRITGDI